MDASLFSCVKVQANLLLERMVFLGLPLFTVGPMTVAEEASPPLVNVDTGFFWNCLHFMGNVA